jgi:23S rRNA (pseudouridine1915-N3)-methyltransferase
MRFHLIAIGKSRPGPAQALFREYAGRLNPPLALVEVEEKRPLGTDALKAREAELLLAHVPAGAHVLLLDERGAEFSSSGLAERIAKWRDRGIGDVAILIGGAAGHGEAARARANDTLCLGRMTWPHMLVRGLIAEQLYRAQQILVGHPYHRE